jgi:nicotinate dehydrogenase subunit B
MNAHRPVLSRRAVLASTGALIVAFDLHPSLAAPSGPAALPGSLSIAPKLDSWIQITPDGHITVFTGKAELGQGIRTALIQIAAEQLDVPVSAIDLVTADTARTPNEGYTAGSHSMQDSGTAIMNAAAQVRALLVEEAGRRLNVPAVKLTTRQGRVSAPDGRGFSYGDLVSGISPKAMAQPGIPTKDPTKYTVIGKPVQRVDIPAKVTGGEAFIQDLRLPGMVHARIVRQPHYDAKLESVDITHVEKMPGVIKIVRNGSYLAVIASGEWQAILAMRALSAATTWSAGRPLPSQDTIFQTIRNLPSRDTTILDRKSVVAPAGKTLSATYHRPYGMHGSIGPSCAVGLLQNGQLTIWTHTQGVFPDRAALAELTRMQAEHIRCIQVQGAGCYGHNGADDAGADAALLACALPGRPVRVQWMRDQEHTWEPYAPAMVSEARASLDANGNIVDWDYGVWSNTHNERPGNGGRLMPSWALASPLVPDPPEPLPQPEGGGDRNAIPLYDFPSAHVVSHFLPDMPLRISAMRGLGAYTNIFSIESFMDELAHEAGADPVAFRLKHLKDTRARDVVNLAAEKFNWNNTALEKDHGRGFAFARYKNLGAYAAVALELALDRDTGALHVVRAEIAVDSGQAVSVDGIRNQIQGGFLQSSSWTLFEEVQFDTTGILSHDWITYPIMRFSQTPGSVNVNVINRPGEKFLGTGEAMQGPASAAIANAVFNITKIRFRELPLSPAKIKAAISV